MPTKPLNHEKKSIRKSSPPIKKDVLDINKEAVMAVAESSSSSNKKKGKKDSIGIFDAKIKRQKRKRAKNRIRGLISLGVASYLGYHALYACGSPFYQSSEKPCICSAIDPIKLDMYSLYQSEYYKTNLDPYIAPIENKVIDFYTQYGIPTAERLHQLYLVHGQPRLEQTCNHLHNVYQHQVVPLYHQKVSPAITPYLNQAKPYIQQAQIYVDQIQPYYRQNIYPLVLQVKGKADELHQHDTVQQAKEKIMYYIDKAENTDLLPILVKIYWSVIDFYQLQVIPLLNQSHIITHIRLYYKQNVKPYYDAHMKSWIIKVNNRVHLDQLLNHVLAWLPQQRPVTEEGAYYTAGTSLFTEEATESIDIPIVTPNQIPITPPARIAKTVTVSKKVSSSSASTAVADPSPASTTIVSSTATATKEEEATIAVGEFDDDSDIMTDLDSKVQPSVTSVPEFIVPNPDHKEAIYCPTCNSKEEEIIVAPTDKNMATVCTDKHVIAVPTEKEVFEVHVDTDHVAPPSQPTTPNNKESRQQVNEGQQFIIQAPIAPIKEEVVFSIQTEEVTPYASIKDKDILYSIQTEEATSSISIKEEDVVFSIQTEEATLISNLEDEMEQEDIKIINEEIIQQEKDQQKEKINEKSNIFVPPAIEKEELVLDVEKEDDSKEDAFIKVEEVHEPVVRMAKDEEQEEHLIKAVYQQENGEPLVKVRAPVTSPAADFKEPVEKPVEL